LTSPNRNQLHDVPEQRKAVTSLEFSFVMKMSAVGFVVMANGPARPATSVLTVATDKPL
jgi:hypothetical protein